MQEQGRIIKLIGGFYYVVKDHEIYQTRARGNFRKRGIKPLVGDLVKFESTNKTDGYILELLPRQNVLTRPPVANIDLVILVTSLKLPDFQLNLLDRLLVAQHYAGIDTLIYVTKGDLINENLFADDLNILKQYTMIGYPVIASKDPFTSANLARLKTYLADKTAVVTGQSGAGKSTLLNHLQPKLDLKTGVVSTSLNRGKHTTRHVELLPVADGFVADTPGFSTLTLEVPLKELKDQFPDFVKLAPQCRFRGCQHVKEPGCAVKAALENGTIMQSRYDNYLQFRQELAKQQRNVYKSRK